MSHLAGWLFLWACAAFPEPDRTAAPSAVPSLSASPAAASPAPSLGDTPPPLNPLEVKVISALGSLGVAGQRAQLPFRDASIWAELGAGRQLFVNVYPLGTTRDEFVVIDARQIAGIRVERRQIAGAASGSPLTYRFECSGDDYRVKGAIPPGFADMEAFIAAFIRALGCAT